MTQPNNWEDRFWELQKKYNLSLDNENYDDLMKFSKELEQQAREEVMKDLIKICLQSPKIERVPIHLPLIEIRNYAKAKGISLTPNTEIQ